MSEGQTPVDGIGNGDDLERLEAEKRRIEGLIHEAWMRDAVEQQKRVDDLEAERMRKVADLEQQRIALDDEYHEKMLAIKREHPLVKLPQRDKGHRFLAEIGRDTYAPVAKSHKAFMETRYLARALGLPAAIVNRALEPYVKSGQLARVENGARSGYRALERPGADADPFAQ